AVQEYARTAGIPNSVFQITSARRSVERQAHFYAVRSKFVELTGGRMEVLEGGTRRVVTFPGLPGIVKENRPLGPNGKLRPQLVIRDGAPAPTRACQNVVQQVNEEIVRHGFGPSSVDGAPLVCPPWTSPHPSGRGVDITVDSRIPARKIKELAQS